MPKFVFLASDIALFLLLCAVAYYVWHARRTPNLRQTWRTVLHDAPGMSAAVLLSVFLLIAVLDSLHFRPLLAPTADTPASAGPAYSTRTLSLLDHLLSERREAREKTYSIPLGAYQFAKESMLVDGASVRDYPRLKFGGAHLTDPAAQWATDIAKRSVTGVLAGVLLAGALWLGVAALRARALKCSLQDSLQTIHQGASDVPWRAMLMTATILALIGCWLAAIWPYYHVFGTDRTGNDVLYQGIKSIRTAVVLGSLATLATLPFGIVLGILAGYFKKRVDDAIMYLITMLSSIPSVLLLAAFALMIQLFVDKNTDLFETGLERADIRLFLLALVLGVTNWTGLARLLRAETMKLTELDYVQAARAFGVSNAGIMRRHILPNVMHVVLIVSVLEFAGIVLYEAVLAYIGLGVDPLTNSFGSMITTSRFELSLDPAVWWNLLAGFALMVTLVLSMQLFSRAVNEAFDPRARAFRVKRVKTGVSQVAATATK
jgi:peptide/nickel transport system permease protein